MDKLPNHFRGKWSQLSLVRDPSDQTIAKIVAEGVGLSDNPEQGQTFKFKNGALISYGINLPPFLIYADIYDFWDSLAGLNSGLGHPIADPQYLPDGSICSIFQGGHVHRPPGGSDVRPQVFPSDECPAQNRPPVPAHLARGSKNWPVVFRQRWSVLSVQFDPYGKQFSELMGAADMWPHAWPGLTDNDNGGKTLHFRSAKLVSYDFRSPPLLVYGRIHDLWNDLGGVKSGLGHPLADPQILDDGSICSVFEGGHIHQFGTRDPEVFPEDQCLAPLKPAVPRAVSNASTWWPQHFRKKWTELSVERDPRDYQIAGLLGPTDCWPHSWPGLTDNDNGGKTLHFRQGRLISNTFQSPPILIYGKIFELWDSLGGFKSGFGYPIADPQILDDGSICSIFEGGHVHQAGSRDAEIAPPSECTAPNQPVSTGVALNISPHWPAHFRSKWASLAWQRDPSGKQLASLLGPADCWPYSWPGLVDNADGGKTLHFRSGRLISYDSQTPPFLIYGSICDVWLKLGDIKSDLKYPLADPQFLPDESICSVFEGGHIHQPRGSKEADVYPAAECTAPHKPISRASQIIAPVIPAALISLPVQDHHPQVVPSDRPEMGALQAPSQDYPPPNANLTTVLPSQEFHPYPPPPQYETPSFPPAGTPSFPPAEMPSSPPAEKSSFSPAETRSSPPAATPSSPSAVMPSFPPVTSSPVTSFQPASPAIPPASQASASPQSPLPSIPQPSQSVQSSMPSAARPPQSSQTSSQPVHPPGPPRPPGQYQHYHVSQPGHRLGGAMSMVGRGIRTLGEGINRVADAIEKRNEGQP